mmetsp:Transcript_36723/g.146849  ORF Transcript_36723/g.146849 Transcript_36723/m.146849 type:complete len:85 (-) Transcript_36723:1836-2090(-)
MPHEKRTEWSVSNQKFCRIRKTIVEHGETSIDAHQSARTLPLPERIARNCVSLNALLVISDYRHSSATSLFTLFSLVSDFKDES